MDQPPMYNEPEEQVEPEVGGPVPEEPMPGECVEERVDIPEPDEIAVDVPEKASHQIHLLRPFEAEIPVPQKRHYAGSYERIFEGKLDSDNKPTGYGILYQNGVSAFYGSFRSGTAEGPGMLFMKDGSYYKGLIVNGKAEDSNGVYSCEDFIYEGGFRNNQFNGNAVERGKTSNYVFNGTYVDGKRREGLLRWNEGKAFPLSEKENFAYSYKGQFDEHMNFDGEGTLSEPKGEYVGTFKHGKKDGKGTYRFVNKLRYVGDYKDDVRSGYGTIYNEDETIAYVGDFEKGFPHGEGGVYNEQNELIKSKWVDGIDSRYLE